MFSPLSVFLRSGSKFKLTALGFLFVLSLSFLSDFSYFPASAFAQETNEILPNVSVSAPKIVESANNAPEDVTILTAKEIKKLGFTTITQAISSVMGVQVNEYGDRGQIASLSIQGSTSEQVLVLVDGKRLNSPSLGDFDLNELPVTINDVKCIEIYRGVSSSIYGNDAMGGVINIITKNPGKKLKGTVSSSYGSFDTRKVGASLSQQKGFLGYVLSAENETSAGYVTDGNYGLRNLDGKITMKLAKNANLVFNANIGYREEGVPGSVEFPSPGAWEHDANQLYGLILNVDKLSVNLYSNYSRNHYVYTPYLEDSLTETSINGLNIQDMIAIGDHNLVTVGGDAIQEKLNSSDVGFENRISDNAFIQDELSFTKRFVATLGSRYANVESGPHVITFNISALYRLFSATTLRASAGTGFSLPTFNELYWPNEYGSVGNPNLQPEKSREYEISAEQRLWKNFSVTATGFRKNVDNLILWQTLPSGTYMPLNIDNAAITGLELNADYAINNLDLSLSYFYQNPNDENTGLPIPYMPKNNLKGHISYEIPSGLRVTLTGNYNQDYVSPGTQGLSYFYLNGRISQRVPLASLLGYNVNGEIFIEGKNILNRNYEIIQGYPMPPAAVTGGLSVSF